MRHVLPLLFASVLLSPGAAAHSLGLDNELVGPGGVWTWLGLEEGTLTYSVDESLASTVTVQGAGAHEEHRVELRDGQAANRTLSIHVGDFVTFVNRDNRTHKLSGVFEHAAAAKGTPAPAVLAVAAVLLAVAALSRRR